MPKQTATATKEGTKKEWEDNIKDEGMRLERNQI
jgi:predicted RecA/RadA family phage recombinase